MRQENLQRHSMGFQGLGDRTDDTRFRNPQSSREDTSFLRGIGSQMQAQTPSASDARASLHRRFTTNTVPQLSSLSPLSPIAQQRRAAAEPVSDLSSAVRGLLLRQYPQYTTIASQLVPLKFFNGSGQAIVVAQLRDPASYLVSLTYKPLAFVRTFARLRIHKTYH